MNPPPEITELYELVIFSPTPESEVNDFDIMGVMSELYESDCSFTLMEKVMDEFIENDRALVFVGSKEDCDRGKDMFEKCDICATVDAV